MGIDIVVNRLVRPIYPKDTRVVVHLDLESAGSSEYEFSAVEKYLLEAQYGEGKTTGMEIYMHLKRNDLLKTCLNLRDGEEIAKINSKPIRDFLGGDTLFLWKSVVKFDGDVLHVPGLGNGGREITIGWYSLGNIFRNCHPAARFSGFEWVPT
jgi:hypothetical protein